MKIELHVWPGLRKAGFHAHNSITHVAPSNDSCTHWLTIQAGIDVDTCLGYFCCSLLLRNISCSSVLGSPSNICIPFDKQKAGCNSVHDWPMIRAFYWIQLLYVVFGGENVTNGCHLAGFSEEVSFAHHFMATRPSTSIPPCKSSTVMATLLEAI